MQALLLQPQLRTVWCCCQSNRPSQEGRKWESSVRVCDISVLLRLRMHCPAASCSSRASCSSGAVSVLGLLSKPCLQRPSCTSPPQAPRHAAQPGGWPGGVVGAGRGGRARRGAALGRVGGAHAGRMRARARAQRRAPCTRAPHAGTRRRGPPLAVAAAAAAQDSDASTSGSARFMLPNGLVDYYEILQVRGARPAQEQAHTAPDHCLRAAGTHTAAACSPRPAPGPCACACACPPPHRCADNRWTTTPA